jgi:hypothetical protein
MNKLISLLENGTTSITYGELLRKIDAKPQRLEKLVNDLARFDELFSLLKEDTNTSNNDSIIIKQEVKDYWQRVFSAVMMVSRHIFDTPENKHPLIYEESGAGDVNKQIKWITSADLEYMTLIMIYALVRMAWEKNVLIIGMIKDTAAAELSKSIVPILQNAHKIHLSGTAGCIARLPNFNTDKQLLQIASVIKGQSVKAPWRTFEFDSCFRTIAPMAADSVPLKNNEATVKGAYKNVISAERIFVKSYIQLWQSENDLSVRSHVFSYDRPCYPGFDTPGELLLHHIDGNVEEEIQPMIHFDKDSEISHLVMDILCSMAQEVIPEALGHNYPLFLADKKAKSILGQMRSTYLSTVRFELANSEFDQQVLYEQKFRDFRSHIENSRRAKS